MADSIRELKYKILNALRSKDEQALTDTYFLATYYYRTPGAHIVDEDFGEWGEVNSAIETQWGEDGLARVKRQVAEWASSSAHSIVVEDAVARGMRDGKLPS